MKWSAVVLMFVVLLNYVVVDSQSLPDYYSGMRRQYQPSNTRSRPRQPPVASRSNSRWSRNRSISSRPSYLDPRNFNLPSLTLRQMENTLEKIDFHIRNKEMMNAEDYTGSRLLIVVLREQCTRLAPFGDASLRDFCSRFNSRFRSLLI